MRVENEEGEWRRRELAGVEEWCVEGGGEEWLVLGALAWGSVTENNEKTSQKTCIQCILLL